MAGIRLEWWNTLSTEELRRRVQIELARTDLSFAETQLLDAALERLRTTRGPSRTPREMKVKGDDTEVIEATEQPVAEEVKEKKPKRARKAKVKAEAAEVERSDFHTGLNGGTDKPAATEKEPDVKRGASKARGGKKRNSAGAVAKTKKEASSSARSRIDLEGTVTWLKGAENPFREGSGSHKRTELVKKNSGKTAEAINKLSGMQSQTLSTLKRKGLIKIG
jgi:hypothetical protein